jgi:hypothetical protein
MTKELLQNEYDNLFLMYGIEPLFDGKRIGTLVGEILRKFVDGKKCPAIYANGLHTNALLSDYVFILKKVKIIIDNYNYSDSKEGYRIIPSSEINTFPIDGVIVSSYVHRNDIKDDMRCNFKSIPVLDIYDELSKAGIILKTEYYKNLHPHHHYHVINELNRSPKNEDILFKLVTKYLQIKDFRMALKIGQELLSKYNKPKYGSLVKQIDKVYNLEKEAIRRINKENVLLLCLDGFRRSDLNKELAPKMYKQVIEKGYYYSNAYSYSTSTFESMLPIYAEDYSHHSRLYEKGQISETECRFIKAALAHDRQVFFYTDMDKYIDSEAIIYSGKFQTLTQKLWDYILDAINCTNGLFLLHELYESHYSFSNPYADYELITEGTAMLFDFLPQKGEKLRTDYIKQHDDAIKYIDDTLGEVLELSSNTIILFADHGNLLLQRDTKLKEVNEMQLLCSNEWTEVPLVIFNSIVGEDKELISLSILNNCVINAIEKKELFLFDHPEFIKMARSAIYNPDFKKLYKKMGFEIDLMGFECFLFRDGIKILVYENGMIRFFLNDVEIEADYEKYATRIDKIREYVTICAIK